METSPSGRVLPILGGSMMNPAACGICGRPGSDVEEVFADPQVYEEFTGNFYLCKDCALSCAAIFGAYSKEEIADTVQQRDELLVKSAVQSSRIQELEASLDTLSVVRLRDRGVTVDGGTIPSETVNESPDGTSERSEATDISGAGESPESTEPGSSEGPSNIDEFTSSDADEFIRSIV